MSIGSCVSLTFTAVLAFTLLPSSPARADRAKDAGPEDGILCCSGLGPFLFQGDKVMVVTGRAGIFRSASRGEIWTRSMDGLVGQNGVAPFADYNPCRRRRDWSAVSP